MDSSHINGVLKKDFPLKNLSWFKTGGLAKYFFSPSTIDDLIVFLQNKPQDLEIFVLGAGSNLLIRDGGFNGCVIKLQNLNNLSLLDNNHIYAQAGASNMSVSNLALQNGIANFEFITGIPGTIGGGIAMNAGCFESEFKDIFVSAIALDKNGNKKELSLQDMGFSYRKNALLEPLIFVCAIFKGDLGNVEKIRNKLHYIKATREENQPKKALTGGSTFANPALDECNVLKLKAWQLLDKVGMRGFTFGGACFSEKHCNFLINYNNATSLDIENLIKLAQQRVFEQFGIYLHTEIKIIGEQK